MTDTGDTGTNLANAIRVLKKFDGSNPAGFKAWIKKFCFVTGVIRRDILPLLKGEETPTDTAEIADYKRANEDLYAMLSLLVELPAALVSGSTRTKARSAVTDKQPSRSSAATTTRLPMRSSTQPWRSS